MKLTSTAFADGGVILPKYTCNGEDISPQFSIEGAPSKARELALIMEDPDAQSVIWTHWTIWGITPKTSEIESGSIPVDAKQGMTSFGSIGYGGPCPSSGVHRYFFKLYALNKEVNLPNGATVSDFKKEISTRIIDCTEIMGVYGYVD